MKLNPHHFRATAGLFEELEIIPIRSGRENLEAFKQGRIDFVPKTAGLRSADFDSVKNKGRIHASHPIHVTFASFTEAGRSKFSQAQRMAIGGLLRHHILTGLSGSAGIERIDGFFPKSGEGALTEDQKQKYDETMQKFSTERLPGNVRIVIGPSLYDELLPHLKNIAGLSIEKLSALPWKQKPSEQPDAFLVAGDTSFFENISLLHYYYAVGVFGSLEEGDRWIADYMLIENKTERMKVLRELHLNILMSGNVIPMYATNYGAIIRNPHRMEFSPFFAGSPPWKMFVK
jgi:hypothetical protein